MIASNLDRSKLNADLAFIPRPGDVCFQNLIVKCYFMGLPCAEILEIQHHVNQEYGNCFSFTYQDPVKTTGQKVGLTVWFNLEVYDTLGLFTPNSGLKMYISDPQLRDSLGMLNNKL